MRPYTFCFTYWFRFHPILSSSEMTMLAQNWRMV